jgi:CheY-like chemotaxis protein
VIVVSPSFAWQLSDSVQERIRKLGVSHILMFSQAEGFVEVSPPTHMEPLIAAVARLSPGGSRVLLVDDDPEYGSVIEFELVQAGYAVERAYNGVDAVTAAGRGAAVLVLDLALPQLDGFGVLEELNARGLSVPTIVLTALDDAAVEARLRELGAVEVFRKFELILAAVAQEAARVREILTPVLAANPSEVSREAGLLSNGTA